MKGIRLVVRILGLVIVLVSFTALAWSVTITISPAHPTLEDWIMIESKLHGEGDCDSFEWDAYIDGNWHGGGCCGGAGGIGVAASELGPGNHRAKFDYRCKTTGEFLASGSKTFTISQPNQKPTARFTYSPLHPKAGETVTFDASSSNDPDGTIISYHWDFGDGHTGSGETASHTYSKSGRYIARLRGYLKRV